MAALPWCEVTLRRKTRNSKRSAGQAGGIVAGKKVAKTARKSIDTRCDRRMMNT
jgi:hypothetical protein